MLTFQSKHSYIQLVSYETTNGISVQTIMNPVQSNYARMTAVQSAKLKKVQKTKSRRGHLVTFAYIQTLWPYYQNKTGPRTDLCCSGRSRRLIVSPRSPETVFNSDQPTVQLNRPSWIYIWPRFSPSHLSQSHTHSQTNTFLSASFLSLD